jgi:hypothetical protein
METLKIIESNELEKVVTNSGIEIKEGEEIKKSYLPFIAQFAEIKEQSNKINFESPTQLDEVIARELRLKTVKIRTGCFAFKNGRKKIYDLRAQIEQDSYNLIKSSCELAEHVFEQVEKAREIAEKKRKDERKIKRVEILTALEFDYTYTDLLNMDDDSFDKLVLKLENEKSARLEAERKAKEEAEAKAKTEALENERIRIENEKLKKEAEEKEKQIQIEKAKALAEQAKQDALMEAQRALAAKKLQEEKDKAAEIAKEEAEKQAKIQAELKAKADKLAADLKAKQDAEKAEKAKQEAIEKAAKEAAIKASKAPDKEKLIKFIESFTYTDTELSTSEAKVIKGEVINKFTSFCEWSKSLIEKL